MNRAATLGLLLALAAALVLRCTQPDARPMHNDEGVNALKFKALWERGVYRYDPDEYHGPALPYFTLAWMKLTHAPEIAQQTEGRLRFVTVLFGVGLILLLPLIADGLGRRACVCAAVFTAISPAMVFYSRYYIHEMPLVFFTFLAFAAAWRYRHSGKSKWALLAGTAVGLMQATKETFVLTLGAAALAWIANEFWDRRIAAASPGQPFRWNFKHLAAAVAVWAAVAVVFFSSFFTNWNGVADAVRTYLPWLHRAQGASPHVYPWYFYLERLAWFGGAKGPYWSEALILVLAVAGIVAVFKRKIPADASLSLLRFVAFYTVALMVIYCAIAYKTPWCLLSFHHGMILLAGVGTVAIFESLRERTVKFAVAIVLVIAAVQLANQAWRLGTDYAADTNNPYAFSQTSRDALRLVNEIKDIAAASPQGKQTTIKVMVPEDGYGPLPWYLRNFEDTGWWSKVPADPYSPIMIVATSLGANLDRNKTRLMAGLFELRPSVFLELYVETNLWSAYLKSRPAPAPEP
jgi:uncharacterized protein (TIGR03663 family)